MDHENIDYLVSYEPETRADRLFREKLPRETINGTTYVVNEKGDIKQAGEEGLRESTKEHLRKIIRNIPSISGRVSFTLGFSIKIV